MSVCQGVPVSMDGSVTRSEFSTVSRIQRETETGGWRERERERQGKETEKENGRERVRDRTGEGGKRGESREVIRAGIVRTGVYTQHELVRVGIE